MRLVSSALVLALVGLGTVGNAQPGVAVSVPPCVSQRIALQRQALAVADLETRGHLLAALPVCGPPIVQDPEVSVPWSDVSHINGQLVPVGERNAYLVAAPWKVVIATNPIGWLVGFYGISASVALSDHVALRGNAEYFDYEFLGHTTGHELALSAPIYLLRTFSGPFIEPGVVYQETLDTPWDLFGDGESAPGRAHLRGPRDAGRLALDVRLGAQHRHRHRRHAQHAHAGVDLHVRRRQRADADGLRAPRRRALIDLREDRDVLRLVIAAPRLDLTGESTSATRHADRVAMVLHRDRHPLELIQHAAEHLVPARSIHRDALFVERLACVRMPQMRDTDRHPSSEVMARSCIAARIPPHCPFEYVTSADGLQAYLLPPK